ncbi:hypothetical protein BCV70DRAFT_98381 [Testicularia cyperi]|uniref:Uncharacterized protein n=1 Tax=Testicularia cyperi TaxID=1882483 RepID=A0A317XRU1_9BASI|nr:hypothetical protein BCV70DRAFT_98381 [Testicularia cyperi]
MHTSQDLGRRGGRRGRLQVGSGRDRHSVPSSLSLLRQPSTVASPMLHSWRRVDLFPTSVPTRAPVGRRKATQVSFPGATCKGRPLPSSLMGAPLSPVCAIRVRRPFQHKVSDCYCSPIPLMESDSRAICAQSPSTGDLSRRCGPTATGRDSDDE